MLGLSAGSLARHGAVSEAARAMAEGRCVPARRRLRWRSPALPAGGGRPGKPVGTVFLAFARTGKKQDRTAPVPRGRQAVSGSGLAALEGLCKKAGN
jgi:nicotinamide mononucleotide (NMN) deamidase PncC